MDVQMPDGTIIPGVPDGITKAQLQQKYEAYLRKSQPAARTTAQEIGRQAGLTARHVIEGGAGLVGIAADPLGAILSAATGEPYQPLQEYASGLLDKAGLPKPETGTERVVGAASRGLVGAGGFVKGGQVLAELSPRLLRKAGELLATNPGTQAAAAVSGAGASEVARENGASPGIQAAVGLGAGLAVPGAFTGAQAAVRGAFRGGEAGRQLVEDNLRRFKDVGTTPTVGQATEGRAARGAETLLSRAPGGSGQIANKAEAQAGEIGATVEGIAAKIAPSSSPERAGIAIKNGVRGEGGFVENFKAKQASLYDELDKHIQQDQQIKVDATRKALDALNADIPGAPNLSQWFKNARISGIRGALVKDTEGTDALLTRKDIPDAFKQMLKTQEGADLAYTLRNLQDGTLPYEAVKKLRTLVGNELADNSLASDVPRRKWKALYTALSEDMGAAVAGNKPAEAAWNRANNYTRTGMKRIELIDSVIDRHGGPEAVFKAATSGTRDGATVLRSVMQSLPESSQKQVSATVIRRMGRANPSNQNDLGETFSAEKFLTNWNTLSPEAKTVLFNRYGKSFRQDMDRVAQVASNMRSGSKVYSNPSGTGQAVVQASTATTFALSLLTGHVGAAAAIAGGVGSANLASRLMVKPEFVSWLAKSTRVPVGSIASQASVLKNAARKSGDQELMDFADRLKAGPQEGQ